ncbi:fungal-specific transcription factor domain-containing protein [Lipomyces doorenjongii]
MTTLSPKFLVFDSKTGPTSEEGGLIYCSSKDANVQWPKSVRRGRPRKDLEEHWRSSKYPLKEVERPSKQRYEFVDCSDGRRPNDPNTRKVVRTHVMHNYQRQKRGLQDMEIESQDNDAERVVEFKCPLILSPERWSRDPFNSFPIKMQPHMHHLLYIYVSAAANHLYQIEAYWGFNPTEKLWVPLALTDPALLSSILFSSEQFEARMNGQKERPAAINHLTQTFRILIERLQDPLQEISDSTIAAVAGLALTEQSSGNQTNWRIHMRGIKRMVEMRGGLLAFEGNPILHDKLCRADICGSIYSLSKPYLQMESRRVQPSVLRGCDETERTLAPGFQAVHDDYGFDSDLFDILYKVHTVTQDINTVNPPKSEVIPLRLRERIRSVQYYLLSRENYDFSGSGDQLLKACRLGVLLYVGIIQNEFMVSPISKQLIWQLKSCLQRESFAADSMRALRLWLIFLTGSLVLDPIEKLWFVCSIVEAVSQLSLPNWCDAKLLLETFAWAGKVQDKSGRDLWDEAMRMQSVLRE